ncbi:hypothetical protein Rsub_12430 [Raphidocelis subcapitata]|uniref:CARDB domain-containing protein n=1 Tax=Raphidocelis subcapitata TaxID=307507 RepID=A0A2V0PQE0_9CHLO|nr:hypothetical protein Rsub_12430 [Raphidocelis subcapitata]|eukprot:GBF99717.1 hypothetical protein Rsub_12430 [Raphidocelis subcapitata]
MARLRFFFPSLLAAAACALLAAPASATAGAARRGPCSTVGPAGLDLLCGEGPAAATTLGEGAVGQSFNYLTFFGTWSYPKQTYVKPGGKVEVTIWVWSQNNETTPEGVKLAVWPNAPAGSFPACGDLAGAEVVQLKPLKPYQLVSFKVKVTAPTTPGLANLRYVVDAGCLTYNFPWYQDQHYQVLNSTKDKVWDLTPIGTDIKMTYTGEAATAPGQPVANGTYKFSFKVFNGGNTASPLLSVVGIWPNAYEQDWPGCNDTTGGTLVPIGAVGPGKSKKVDVTLDAGPYRGAEATVSIVTNPYCRAPSGDILPPTNDYFYPVSQFPEPAFAATRPFTKSFLHEVTTAPKAPKPGSNVTVKVKAINTGSLEGTPGKVIVSVLPFNVDWASSPLKWEACGDYSGQVAEASFGDVKLKPGKTKTLKIKDVPVPLGAAPGSWWLADVMFDVDCANTYSERLTTRNYFNVFQIKA